jgi:hypothetical protein
MPMRLPKPFQSSGQYQGKYKRPVFKMMDSPSHPLHQNLYEALAKYGASVQDMRIENIGTGNASVTYEIASRSTTVRVRVDMLDISCTNLFAFSAAQAYQFIADCWNALKAADDSIELLQHVLSTSAGLTLTREIQQKVFEPILNFPKDIDPRPDVGIAFYFPGGSRDGDQGSYLVLDSLNWNSGFLRINAGMTIDATKIGLADLASYADDFLTSLLGKFGLEIEQAKG